MERMKESWGASCPVYTDDYFMCPGAWYLVSVALGVPLKGFKSEERNAASVIRPDVGSLGAA
jgi:hypothetical protein